MRLTSCALRGWKRFGRWLLAGWLVGWLVGGIILKAASSLSPPSVPSPPMLCHWTLHILLDTLYNSNIEACTAHFSTRLHKIQLFIVQIVPQPQQHLNSILCIDFGPRPLMGLLLEHLRCKAIPWCASTINSLVNCGSCLPPTKCKFAISLLTASFTAVRWFALKHFRALYLELGLVKC